MKGFPSFGGLLMALSVTHSAFAQCPQIQTPPQDQEKALGEAAMFSVTATGTPPLFVRWRYNGTILPGETNALLVISNLTAFHYGAYSVIVSNSSCSVTSSPANLYLFEDSDEDGLSDRYESGTGRYRVITGNFTWAAAKTNAEALGGHLATVTTQDEWNFLVGIFGTSLNGLWLGGSDGETEGVWKWITGEPWSFSLWSPVQPDGSGDALWIYSGNTMWDDTSPSDLRSYLFEIGYPSNPNNPDTDGDGLSDADEVTHQTFPNFADSDQDGLSDGAEVLLHGTNPLVADTDHDGFNDFQEIYAGTNPNNPASFPTPEIRAFTALELEFFGNSNKTYYIQASPDFVTWTNFYGPIIGTEGIWSNTFSIRGRDRLFYRVEIVP